VATACEFFSELVQYHKMTTSKHWNHGKLGGKTAIYCQKDSEYFYNKGNHFDARIWTSFQGPASDLGETGLLTGSSVA